MDWKQIVPSFIIGAIMAFAATFFLMGQRVAKLETQYVGIKEAISTQSSHTLNDKTKNNLGELNNIFSSIQTNLEQLLEIQSNTKFDADMENVKEDMKMISQNISVANNFLQDHIGKRLDNIEKNIRASGGSINKIQEQLTKGSDLKNSKVVAQTILERFLVEYAGVGNIDRESEHISVRSKYNGAISLLNALESIAKSISESNEYTIFVDKQRRELIGSVGGSGG